MSGLPRARIVLYNPRASFYTMPLALVALASALDRRRFDVRIIDGRLESDPVRAVETAAEGSLCVGVSVLTGAPIRDALAVSRAVKAAHPACTVVWGGWHPSLFPEQCLEEPSVRRTAELCARHGVAAIFNCIVGFPAEPDESVRATLDLLHPPQPVS